MKISIDNKYNILKEILSQSSPFENTEREITIMDFLMLIWNLEEMPSEDSRYSNAYDDVYQHIINNNDWTYEELFSKRLKLINDNERFIIFINLILSPKLRSNEDDVMNYFYLVIPYLEKDGYDFNLVGYAENDIPIYEVVIKNEDRSTDLGIKINDIPFFVEFTPNGRSNESNSFSPPNEYPSFMLVLNDGWNDFNVISEFNLFYFPDKHTELSIGEMKIIHKTEKDISDVMDLNFMALDINFCSLGQNLSFYNNLKKEFGIYFESILWALRDSAFFPEIHENFENNKNFKKSIIRFDEQERLLREAKYRIYDYDLSNIYSFKYQFDPKFADNEVTVEFNFKNDKKSFDRIYAIIGENGTGKTQLITSLPIDISNKNNSNFIPNTPLFSKVIAVSYSVFDSFKFPKKTASFNYLYCGLKNIKGEQIPDKELLLRFHKTRRRIKKIGRINQWLKILNNFIDNDLINQFLILEGRDFLTSENEYKFDIEEFEKVRKQLSSGQSIILYIITELVAHIRYDSLIIYDEPETHLHPNAISQLINTIYELTREFQSYCIIATHSPIIIRELLSKNVFIMKREVNHCSIRKIGIESFGENLSVLTEEVFGNREIPKQYKLILQNLVNKGFTYDEIINELESDEVPLSLNANLYLKTIINEKS